MNKVLIPFLVAAGVHLNQGPLKEPEKRNSPFSLLMDIRQQLAQQDTPLLPEDELLKEEYLNIEVPMTDLPTEIPKELQEHPLEKEPDSFPVIFRAFSRGVLSTEVSAVVLQITKRMGERFQEGELLIRLNDRVYQGLRRKALGNLGKGEAELASKQKLYQDGIASIYEVKSAEANVAAALSDLINAEHAINACYILAPFNGKVVTVFVEEFELIQEGKPLVEVVNDELLIGQVLVPARLLSHLKLGKPVKIHVLETDTIENGEILRIDAVIDPASSLIKVDIVVDNREERLRSGMIGEVMIEEEKSPYTTIKPTSMK